MSRRLKDSARALWSLEDAASVTVSELACDHADCPGVETVIAVLRAGQAPAILRIPKRLPDVTEDDLFIAIPGDGHLGRGPEESSAARPERSSKSP